MSTAVTTPAPRGARCTECLCCDAEIIVEFEGRKQKLCAACDDGTHPAFAIKQPTPPAEPLGVLSPSDTTAKPNPEPLEKEKPMGTPGRKTSEATKAAILAEPLTLSNSNVGLKHGVSGMTVGVIRRQHGLASQATNSRAAAALDHSIAAALAKATVKSRTIAPITDAPIAAPVASPLLPQDELTPQMIRDSIDHWFRKLDLVEQVAIFYDNYVQPAESVRVDSVRLEGTVS